MGLPVRIVRDLREADAVITLKNYYRRRPQQLREAEERGVPIYVVRSNTIVQMNNLMRSLFGESIMAATQGDEERAEISDDHIAAAMFEAETAIHDIMDGADSVELQPQSSRVRRLQHELVERYNLISRSRGREPNRHVEIFRGSDLA